MAVRRLSPDDGGPSAPQRDPGRDAYLAWCADCEQVLRLILLGSDAEIADWAIIKAQARRVARQIEDERLADGRDRQDLGRLHALMQLPATDEDERVAEGLRERVRKTRAWAIAELGGDPSAILRRLVGGLDPEAMLALLDARSLPPPTPRAEAYARSQVGVRRPRSEEERMADAEATAELWMGRE